MWKTQDGSTSRLLQLCLGYFVFYTITGLAVKYFLGSTENGFPGMKGIEYLTYSTIGGTSIAISVVLALRWHRFTSNDLISAGPLRVPRELAYIIPSGVCTAIVIPTTTLIYTLPISVMVAMVIMRGAIIVVSRIIDAIQIRQGLLKKKVYMQENLGVVFALAAVAIKIFWRKGAEGSFDFLHSQAAMTILSAYIFAYAIRIYIMNYYKNTVGRGVPRDNRGFFAIEQIAASGTLLLVALVLLNSDWLAAHTTQIQTFQQAIRAPHAAWPGGIFSGMAFGIVAFFSVFIFMFKGRTATFAGLVNRLTSLIAGTFATLLFYFFFGGKFPKGEDWISLLFIFIAVIFLTQAEHKRKLELVAEGDAAK